VFFGFKSLANFSKFMAKFSNFYLKYKFLILKKITSFFFFRRIFAIWPPKKRAGESNKGIFDIKKTIRHILTKKTLEVARIRQCVAVGRQN